MNKHGNIIGNVRFNPWENTPYVSDELRYRVTHISGIQGPAIEATALDPGGSDGRLETALIALSGGKPVDLLIPHVVTNYEDAVCTGTYGSNDEPCVLVIPFLWGNEAHFEAHHYEITLYILHHNKFCKRLPVNHECLILSS